MYGRDAGQLEEIRRSARERWRADHGELSAHPMNPSSTAFGVGGSRAPSSGDDVLAGARPSERPQPTSSRRDSSSLSNAQSEFESGSFAHSFDARGSAARRSLLFGAALGAGLLGWQTMTAARNVARALRPHVSPVLVTRETSQSARDAQEAQEAEDLRLATRLQAEENAAAARDTSAAFVRTLLGARAHAPQSAFSPDAFFDAFRREFRPREDGASNCRRRPRSSSSGPQIGISLSSRSPTKTCSTSSSVWSLAVTRACAPNRWRGCRRGYIGERPEANRHAARYVCATRRTGTRSERCLARTSSTRDASIGG